ncbi:MAG: hypothetical protein ACOVQG_09260, partial [Crocinitomicaceae bacterium]
MKFTLFLSLIFSLLTIFSCEESQEDNRKVIDESQLPDDHGDLNTYAKRHVEAQLRISANEKYDLKIYKENLDGDDKEDAIIAVNRLNFAIEEAANSENPAKRAEIGYMGNFNFFFYYDGAKDMISPPIVVASSPLLPLKVSFENISSDSYKDILIDFRIRNSSFRDFFSVINHTPRMVFEFRNFDGMGTTKSECYSFQYMTGSYSAFKDIQVMKASLGNVPKDADLNTFDPIITPTK